MVGKELRNFPALADLPHSYPKSRRLFRVIAGERHEEDADVIRLGFLLAIESLAEKNVDATGFFAGDPLVRVVSQRMGRLVSKHGRQLVVVLRDVQDAG